MGSLTDQDRKDLSDLAETQKEILACLKGNDLGQVGLIQQVRDIRESQTQFQAEIRAKQQAAEKERWFQRGMAAGLGVSGGGLAAWLKSKLVA